jgi:carboxyl-terminal processing protease
MRARVSRVVLALGLLLGPAWPAPAQTAPRSCSITAQNLFVRDRLFDLYLWADSLPAVNPAQFPSPEAYLEAVRQRPLDARFSYITSAASSNAFYSDSQFIGFGFSNALLDGAMRVLQVFRDSPAAEAGLARGDRIVEIDGRAVEELIETGQIATAFGPADEGVAIELAFVATDGTVSRQLMVKRAVTIPTVSLTQVYEIDGRRVGYLFFRNFVRPSIAALDEAFATLRAAEVSELVLDLRYNGGGLVDVAQHLGSLIGGWRTAGQVFATYAHNERNAYRDTSLRFEPLEQAAPGLSRLIAITSRSSASASELVLNALSPFMPVVLIGDATYGKPVGQYLIEFCDKVLAPVSFAMRNANDEGAFFDGLPVTCAAADDLTRQLGDAEESALAEAFHFIRHDQCSLPAAPLTALTVPVAPAGPRAVGWQSLVNAQ